MNSAFNLILLLSALCYSYAAPAALHSDALGSNEQHGAALEPRIWIGQPPRLQDLPPKPAPEHDAQQLEPRIWIGQPPRLRPHPDSDAVQPESTTPSPAAPAPAPDTRKPVNDMTKLIKGLWLGRRADSEPVPANREAPTGTEVLDKLIKDSYLGRWRA
ncbi:hypothetical protein HGRIS_006467 [Hohenbuehelia grisea]|uniref:Uncharacterized protein n=1 Tax=Hohenbuehelia grisea TaxID=104357 RepID=A0ABR3K311_9AGAR